MEHLRHLDDGDNVRDSAGPRFGAGLRSRCPKSYDSEQVVIVWEHLPDCLEKSCEVFLENAGKDA